MQTLNRITLNPLVMGGRPCIRGMRITVGNIVGLVAAGHSFETILEEYPILERENIEQALSYAAYRTTGKRRERTRRKAIDALP